MNSIYSFLMIFVLFSHGATVPLVGYASSLSRI